MPCREVVYADAVLMAKSLKTESRLKEQLESKPGPDGHCERKTLSFDVLSLRCAHMTTSF
jgi:hypothetical protein